MTPPPDVPDADVKFLRKLEYCLAAANDFDRETARELLAARDRERDARAQVDTLRRAISAVERLSFGGWAGVGKEGALDELRRMRNEAIDRARSKP